MNKKILLKILISIIIIFVTFNTMYHLTKAMPAGTSTEGTKYYVSDSQIDFMYDLTYNLENGTKVYEQEIFQNVFNLIEGANKFIVIDMFLFNTDYSGKEKLIPITTEIKDKLIEKKKNNPNIEIFFITDEINNFYGSYEAEHIKEMKNAGIKVIITDLSKLRDSNPIYSGFWRSFIQVFGTEGKGILVHPLGNKDHQVTIRAWLKLFNTKANHRKVIIADEGEEVRAIITSANPHTPSSLHSNIAISVKSNIWNDILDAEKSVAAMSNSEITVKNFNSYNKNLENRDITVQLLTEGKIKKSLLETLSLAKEGDSIKIAMFYLSDRDIVKEILKAEKRGASVNIILDPNKDAFAREKNGIPNRQVAKEFVDKSLGNIKVRWYDTRGEQFHTKLIIIKIDGKVIVYAGSANLTRRNIGNLNLEANLKVNSPDYTEFANEVENYFDRIWNNVDANYTLNFEAYRDNSKLKRAIYLFQEGTGLSSF